MRKKQLILFTSCFPYDSTEAFLEAELPFLSLAFERVKIVPMFGRELKRPIPDNVQVAKPFFANLPTQLLFFAFQYAKPRTWHHILKGWIKAMITDRRFHIAVFYRIFNWASYRSALETHQFVQEAMKRPETSVAYSYWGHTPAFAIPMLSRAGVPCAVRYHSVDLYVHAEQELSYIYRNAQYFPWREEVARAASANLLISENGRRHFEDMWPNVLGKSAIISRLGVRDRGLCPSASTSPTPLTIVSCSYVSPRKRVHLIAALAKELAGFRSVYWHHFGNGDLTEVEAVLETAPRQLLSELHGWVSNADVMKFYCSNHVDLFVNLSTREGVPVSIMEAMSFGIPVVATDVDGTSEAVITAKSGLLIHVDEAYQPAVLAKRVIKALEPGGDLQRSTPRAVFEERFCDAANFTSLVDILHTLQPIDARSASC